MKITVRDLKRIIRETAAPNLATQYGMSPDAEPALKRFMADYPGNVKHMGQSQPLAEYLLFVDDMEGFGLMDAIASDDGDGISAIAGEILAEFPAETYNAFAGQGAIHPNAGKIRSKFNN